MRLGKRERAALRKAKAIQAAHETEARYFTQEKMRIKNKFLIGKQIGKVR